MARQFAPLFAVLLLSLGASAQQLSASGGLVEPSWKPHPIVFSGPSLASNGYQPLALDGGGGFLLDLKRFFSDVEGSYTNARKVNDNTTDNYSGHERAMEARSFYTFRRQLYFGGGIQWRQTSTTNYTKQAWHPAFGVGGDYFRAGHSIRWQALYVLPGTDRLNGLQGSEIQIWFPSPTARGHFFIRQTLGIYELHSTITDPTNLILTAQETANRSLLSLAEFDFGFRF